MADSMAAYAQPLIDETDGSLEQMQNAFSIAMMCWNLAVLPEIEQEESIAAMRPALKMDEAEFAAFRREVIAPMVVRHHEMFPNMPRLNSPSTAPFPRARTPQVPRGEKYPGTGRNAPCPCNSGKKYKRCCGK
jgi:preprotein translocase subunit SecA